MRFFLLLGLLYGSVCLHAQQFSVTSQIADLDLPTKEVYKVIQDKKGYLWFATDFGLYRYQQGRTDKINFDVKFGQPPVLTVYETTRGKILFVTLAGQVFGVEKDSAVELPFSRKGYLTKLKEIAYNFIENQQQQLFLLTSLSTYHISSSFEQATRLPLQPFDGIPVLSDNGTLIPLNTNFLSQTSEKNLLFTSLIFPGLIRDTLNVDTHGSKIDRFRILTTRWNDWQVVTYSHSLILLRAGLPAREINMGAPIIGLRADKTGGLWVGLYRRGYRYFTDPMDMHKAVNGLEEISISDICTDTDGGVWMTSLERGVFYNAGTYMLQHATDLQYQTPFTKIYRLDKGLLAASHGQPALFIAANDKKPHQPLPGIPLTNLIHYSGTDRHHYFFNSSEVIIQDRHNGKRVIVPGGHFLLLSGLYLGQNHFITSTIKGLTLYDGPAKIKAFPIPEMIFHLTLTKDSGVLAGTHHGAYYATNYRDLQLKKVPGDNGRVVQLLKTNANNCWVLIQSRGLFLFDQGQLKNLLPARPGERYYSLAEGKNGSIWMASSFGVRIYEEQDILLGKKTSGYPATDQVAYSLALVGERMYMASVNGLVSLPVDPVNRVPSDIPVYLRSWTSGNIELPASDSSTTPVFDHDAGALTWVFDIASVRPEPALLQYRLEGPVNDSGRIDGSRLQLTNLRPGDYQLRVWATRDDGARSAILTRSFRINPPFWQTGKFIAAALIITMLLSGFIAGQIISYSRKRYERRRKMENELLSIRLQALQAQMNPHFIFNAINSIQLFILQQKELEAYHYLTQFSKLIRRVLTQSRHTVIPLSDELETLRLYVGLEQLRFPDTFTFDIRMSPDLPPAHIIYLPVMLLQPVIENAIIHGMPENPGEGNISLEIVNDTAQGIIQFITRDNGNGRNKKASSKISAHEPVSSVINQERIITLNKIYSTDKFGLTITHRDDLNPGTLVLISIPDNLSAHAKI